MRPLICTLILSLLTGIFIYLIEKVLQTWMPMFLLILLSFSLGILSAYLVFRYTVKHALSKRYAITGGVIGVFTFFLVSNLLWRICEEALISYYLSTYGQDDTGGRYFYPGNSGIGYAKGLDNPLEFLTMILTCGIPVAFLIGMPLGIILSNTTKRERTSYSSESTTAPVN